MRHADDDLVERILGALVDHGVHHRDDRLRALERKALLPNVFRLEEGLEGLGGIELGQDVLLLGDRRLDVFDLDTLLNPALLLRFEDVRVLDSHVSAVRVAQDREHVTQLHRVLAVEAADLETTVEIPEGQAVGEDVEIRMRCARVAVHHQRIGVGHEVPAVAVGRDQLEYPRVLVDDACGDVTTPTDRLVGDVERGEQLVVERVVEEQFVDPAK